MEVIKKITPQKEYHLAFVEGKIVWDIKKTPSFGVKKKTWIYDHLWDQKKPPSFGVFLPIFFSGVKPPNLGGKKNTVCGGITRLAVVFRAITASHITRFLGLNSFVDRLYTSKYFWCFGDNYYFLTRFYNTDIIHLLWKLDCTKKRQKNFLVTIFS